MAAGIRANRQSGTSVTPAGVKPERRRRGLGRLDARCLSVANARDRHGVAILQPACAATPPVDSLAIHTDAVRRCGQRGQARRREQGGDWLEQLSS
jgi:hypothetical protein